MILTEPTHTMTTFNDFKNEVFNEYEKLKQKGLLSVELENPSPAKLRNYCEVLYHTKFQKEDAQTIQDYFNPRKNYDDLETAIKRFDTDKLKPLIRFMNGETKNSSEKNIKLLAWLIDFQPRPYENWKKIRAAIIPSSLYPNLNEAIIKPEKAKVNRLELKNYGLKSKLIAGLIGGASLLGVYKFSNLNQDQCMYWADDHYETIGCQDESLQNVQIIALNKYKLENFKRITQPDTLTYFAINKVWYTKITKDSLVFFTGAGQHPIHKQKNLKPITRYIIDKYIYKQ